MVIQYGSIIEKNYIISDYCSDDERCLSLNCLLAIKVFTLSETSGAKPMREAPTRLPYALRRKLELKLDKLLKINCLEPVNSPYASPSVL